MNATAFKVFTVEQWSDFEVSERFVGAPVDIADGYIHLSTAGQLDETMARYFTGKAVYVAEIDLAHYGEAVRWEASRGGDLFPHIYAPALTFNTVIRFYERTADNH
jgi:uncharacterized protein (DUF952 family)